MWTWLLPCALIAAPLIVLAIRKVRAWRDRRAFRRMLNGLGGRHIIRDDAS